VLYSGVACITDLMVKEGLINLDFADVRAVMREMGKAMMGTGEASGEKRAIRAAEAAIANPLLDDVCMKGARGLLISITGGPDLTLYEVDEAATRIREEVDEDANVIFGATRDDSLEGIVRVSVVATGIDQADMVQSAVAATETRLSATAERLRDDTRQKAESQLLRAAAQRPDIRTEAAPAPVQAHAPQPMPAPQPAPIHPEVSVRPLSPKPVYQEPVIQPRAAVSEDSASEAAFIPPRPEEPVMRAARMPQITEFPPQAQREIASRQSQQPPAPPAVEKKRITLMERLAAAGFGRREGREEAPAAPAPRTAQAPAGQAPAQPNAVHNEYGRRPARAAQPGLDVHGRPQPQGRNVEDDQLEIPAFLRRQSN
jgi:cell division protein FtsZ